MTQEEFSKIGEYMRNNSKRFTIKKYGVMSEAIVIKHKENMREFMVGMCKTFGDNLPLNISDYENNNEWAYLHYIEVPDKAKRKGIGSKLINAVTLWAKKRNMNILLTVERYSENLHKFYTHNGFKRVSETMYYKTT